MPRMRNAALLLLALVSPVAFAQQPARVFHAVRLLDVKTGRSPRPANILVQGPKDDAGSSGIRGGSADARDCTPPCIGPARARTSSKGSRSSGSPLRIVHPRRCPAQLGSPPPRTSQAKGPAGRAINCRNHEFHREKMHLPLDSRFLGRDSCSHVRGEPTGRHNPARAFRGACRTSGQ